MTWFFKTNAIIQYGTKLGNVNSPASEDEISILAFTKILREDCKHIRLSKIDHLVTKSVLTQASKLHSLWGNQPSLLLKVLLLLFCYLLLATLSHCIFTVSFDREFILYCIGTPHIKCIRILQHLLFTHTFKNYLHPSLTNKNMLVIPSYHAYLSIWLLIS